MRTWRPDRVQPSIISSQVQSGTLPHAKARESLATGATTATATLATDVSAAR